MSPRDRRVAIVTGAHQGIGSAVAIRLSAAGVSVWCADLNDCGATVATIRSAGGSAEPIELDTTSSAGWSSALFRMAAGGRRPEVLINVAGVLARGKDTVEELTDADWDFVCAVNLKGLWYGMRAVLPGMVAKGWGRIVNVSSMAAFKGQPGLLAYSTTKAGVVGMTQQVAVEYAQRGITVNAVAPGVADTPILQSLSEELKQEYANNHLIKRLVQPAEIAELIAYLVGEPAGIVTGQTFRIDGGATIS